MTIYIIDTEDLDFEYNALLEKVISGNTFLEISNEDLELLENSKGYNLVENSKENK